MLTFGNPGVLDPRAITTFGVNAKDGPNPIGHFGTGFKYAAAIILRLGGKIDIRTQDTTGRICRYHFIPVLEFIRERSFCVVHMETLHGDEDDTYPNATSQALGFTTELGKNWEPWMAYRELRSNAMDEGGGVVAPGTIPAPFTETTISCAEVEAAHAEAGQFFLETAPLWANDDLEIHPARSDAAVFYRGIRVANISAPTALYTYNILRETQLTEDRTIDRWLCNSRIAHSLALLDNAELAEAILLAPERTYEAALSFDYVAEFSDEMRAAIRLQKHNAELNRSARRRAKLLYGSDFAPLALPMTEAQRAKVAQVAELLAACNIPVAWIDIRLGQMPEGEDDAVLLLDDTLWLSPRVFDGEQWLLHILANRWLGQRWDAFREEAQLLAIMHQAHPNLAVFAPSGAES